MCEQNLIKFCSKTLTCILTVKLKYLNANPKQIKLQNEYPFLSVGHLYINTNLQFFFKGTKPINVNLV